MTSGMTLMDWEIVRSNLVFVISFEVKVGDPISATENKAGN